MMFNFKVQKYNSPEISSLESLDPRGGNDGSKGAGDTGLGTFGCFQND